MIDFSGRDHGLPTYVDMLKQCEKEEGKEFKEIKSFKDFSRISEKSQKLLEATYKSVEVNFFKKIFNYILIFSFVSQDVDPLVGAALETFDKLATQLIGYTLQCIVRKHFRVSIGGDPYYYSQSTTSYPFSKDQLAAIQAYLFDNMICENTDIENIGKIWYLTESASNTNVDCKTKAKFDLKPWKV